jgi:hypothetical protein
LARARFLAAAEVTDAVSLQIDYALRVEASPSSSPFAPVALWGSGALWGGGALWGSLNARSPKQRWQAISGIGTAFATDVRVTSGGIATPAIDLVAVDMQFEQGQVIG